ncbi:MAG: ASKHA domain-containing protein [Desulfopila sp.]
MPQHYIITLLPHGRKLHVKENRNLMASLVEHAILLRADCGGKGVCGKCTITLKQSDNSIREVKACQTKVDRDLWLTIPPASMLAPHIVGKPAAVLPPSFTESCNTSQAVAVGYGIAVDLGTTTIALYLCTIKTGSVLSCVSVKNPQAIYGDDVMSRIGEAAKEKDNLSTLHKLAVRAIEWGCRQLSTLSHILLEDVEQMTVVGNPTMIHLLLGIQPGTLGVAPYRPMFLDSQCQQARKLGFEQLDMPVHTLPQISGFLGGDILAAAIAAELDRQPAGTLLIDIGTNGELIYKGEHGLYATSCATGPVFEGASISCGMQALPGAIDKVTIAGRTGTPRCRIIGAERIEKDGLVPGGICGSGIISAAAEMYRAGIIGTTGALVDDVDIAALQKDASGAKHYILAREDHAGENRKISIKQKDIRSIQLGKAALFTGIDFLLKIEGKTLPEKIIIGGAFGSYLDKNDMKDLGLLPNIDDDHIETAGNLAGAGAIMALCRTRYFKAAQKLAAEIAVIDLATRQEFQKSFVANLHFPALAP